MANFEERIKKNGKKVYRVRVRLKGHPAELATFDRLTDARKWAADIESSIRDGRHFKTGEAKKHTLGEMVDRYIRDVLPAKSDSMQRDQWTQLGWWKDKLGDHLLSDITPALISEHRDLLARETGMRKKKRSPASVIRYMAALSHAYTIAMKEWGWVEDSPMRKVQKPKEPRGRVRFLSDNERERLLTACKGSDNSHLYPVVVLALSTGARKMEIMNLTWEDVDLHRGVAILNETKNDERRALPLTGNALELLKGLRKNRRLGTNLLFPRADGQKPIELRNAWERALKQAQIDDFKFHDLRHSAASYLAMSGASLAEIAEVLGHKTLQMVKRYSHLSEQHTAGVVEKMNKKFLGA
jgi:integrase